MSYVVQLLERLGSGPVPVDYDAAIAALDAPAPVRQAFEARDARALNDLVGGRTRMFCLIMTPEEQPIREPEDQPVDPDQDAPAEDDK